LDGGDVVTARWYVDASGHSGVIRRALGVETDSPTSLRNIAIWTYWEDAEWAVTVGASGTRIQVMSLGWGWLWFIPVGETRTSVGLVVPAGYPSKTGKSAPELYDEAIAAEPRIQKLLLNARRERETRATKDWSFVAERCSGPNWLLVGEAAGFADPILSAGLTLTHVGGWEAAIALTELDRSRLDASWVLSEYQRQQIRRVRTHIRFADFWYASNGHFTDLVEHTAEIAKAAGLALDGANAWQWLGAGGFVDTDMAGAGVGGFSLASAAWIVRDFSKVLPQWSVGRNSHFKTDLEGAQRSLLAHFQPRRIDAIPGYEREDKRVPATAVCGFFLDFLGQEKTISEILAAIRQGASSVGAPLSIQVLEAMINDGWIGARFEPGEPLLDVAKLVDMAPFHENWDGKGRPSETVDL
jgi:hypothetical protein